MVTYSRVEKEVILLRAITDLLDEMVNHALFKVGGTPPDQEIRFESAVHQKLFNILLVDLLGKPDKQLVGQDISYLEALNDICDRPCFDKDAVNDLEIATHVFKDWLAVAPAVPIWLPSLNQDIELEVPRCVFIEICGNLSKHSILRQSRPAKKFKKLLESAGVSVDIDDAALALEDFYGRFHNDIFNYHSSALAQMLNEIQWGIYHYLLPEYRRSLVREDDSLMYHFTYPPTISAKFAKALYWDLMNDVRRGPFVQRFIVTRYLKMRY